MYYNMILLISYKTEHFRQFYSNMALDAGTIVVAPEYRLAPEHPYPNGLEDCVETVKYVFDNAESLNIDNTKIVLTGDSAGGFH